MWGNCKNSCILHNYTVAPRSLSKSPINVRVVHHYYSMDNFSATWSTISKVLIDKENIGFPHHKVWMGNWLPATPLQMCWCSSPLSCHTKPTTFHCTCLLLSSLPQNPTFPRSNQFLINPLSQTYPGPCLAGRMAVAGISLLLKFTMKEFQFSMHSKWQQFLLMQPSNTLKHISRFLVSQPIEVFHHLH